MKKQLRFVLMITLIACSGCVSWQQPSASKNQHIGSFEESDRMIARCTALFDEAASKYASSPQSFDGMNQVADQITGDQGNLFEILKMDRELLVDLDQAVRSRNQIVYALRLNAVRVLNGDECGDTADEYLVDALFNGIRTAATDTPLSSQYRRYEASGVSYKTFLLLKLILRVNSSLYSTTTG